MRAPLVRVSAGVIVGLTVVWGIVERCSKSIVHVRIVYRAILLGMGRCITKAASMSLIPKLKASVPFNTQPAHTAHPTAHLRLRIRSAHSH